MSHMEYAVWASTQIGSELLLLLLDKGNGAGAIAVVEAINSNAARAARAKSSVWTRQLCDAYTICS